MRRTGRSARSVVAIVVAGAAVLYGYDVTRNVRARAAVEHKCAELRAPSPDETLFQSLEQWGFLEHATSLRADVRTLVSGDCEPLENELTWWRFNLGRTVTPPSHIRERARLGQAFDRAARVCPIAARRYYAGLSRLDLRAAAAELFHQPTPSPAPLGISDADQAQAAEALCGSVRDVADRYAHTLGHPPAPISVWSWADAFTSIPSPPAPRH